MRSEPSFRPLPVLALLLIYPLLAAPLLAVEMGAVELEPGTMALSVSPWRLSTFEVLKADLPTALCGVGGTIAPQIAPSPCTTKIDDDGPRLAQPSILPATQPQLLLQLPAGVSIPATGAVSVPVVVEHLALPGAQVLATSCGSWSFEVDLRASEAGVTALLFSLSEPGEVLFQGVLDVPITLRFVRLEDRQQIEIEREWAPMISGRQAAIGSEADLSSLAGIGAGCSSFPVQAAVTNQQCSDLQMHGRTPCLLD